MRFAELIVGIGEVDGLWNFDSLCLGEQLANRRLPLDEVSQLRAELPLGAALILQPHYKLLIPFKKI